MKDKDNKKGHSLLPQGKVSMQGPPLLALSPDAIHKRLLKPFVLAKNILLCKFFGHKEIDHSLDQGIQGLNIWKALCSRCGRDLTQTHPGRFTNLPYLSVAGADIYYPNSHSLQHDPYGQVLWLDKFGKELLKIDTLDSQNGKTR